MFGPASGDQDAAEQSHREGGAEGGDGCKIAIGRETAGVGGLLDAEHIVYRTAESDDPARLRVSLPQDDMSCSPEGTVGGPFGVASMLLQFRQIKSGVEIRAGSPDASHAGWIDQKAADITGDLLFGRRLSGIGRDRAPLRLFCYIIICRECGASTD